MARCKTNGRSHVDIDTMRPSYDFTNAVRGQTAKRYADGTNIVVLDPDVSRAFPSSVAVNDALRVLARLAQLRVSQPRKKRTA